MLRWALALWAACTWLAGCQAQAEVHSSSPSAGIPEIVSRCIDGRDIAGELSTCTSAVDAKVDSEQLRDLARYSLALAQGRVVTPDGIPEPILRCLYSFNIADRIAYCTYAIEAKTGSTEMQAMAHHARAIAHCWDRHPERSVADETKAVSLVSNFPAAYAHRSVCKGMLGDLKGARADQAEALRLAPDVPGYHREAAMWANLVGDHDAALKHLGDGIRRWPQFNELLDLRAKTLFNLGRYDEAAEAFAQTVKAFPGDPPPVLWLHLARMRAGQPDTAEFATNTAGLDVSGWMKPMFDYYQDRADYGAAVLASRESDDASAECMAQLFIAEHLLAKKQVEMATMFFGGAVSTCNPAVAPTSAMAAWAELKKISPNLKGEGWSRWAGQP